MNPHKNIQGVMFKMSSEKHKIKAEKIPEYAVTVILIIQIIMLIFINMTRSVNFLDYDSALVLSHAAEMWNEGTVFLKDHNSTSSLEIDCIVFWAYPLSKLTGSINTAYGILHCFIIALTVLLVYLILSRNKIKPLFIKSAAVMILTPYTSGQLEYANMLFISAGQYAFRMITMLFMLLFYDYDWRKEKKKKTIPLVLIFLFFLTVSTLSCGSYMLIMIIAPFILAHGVTWIKNRDSKLINARFFFLASSCAAIMPALALRKIFEVYSNNTGMTLCPHTEFADNILSCITGILIILGIVPQNDFTAVFSSVGIASLAKGAALAVLTASLIRCIRTKEKCLNKGIFCAAACFALCHLTVLTATNTKYGATVFESRYHIYWLIMLMLVFTVCIDTLWDKIKNTRLKYIICAAMICTAAAANYSQMNILLNITSDPRCEEIVNTASAEGADTILFYGEPQNTSLVHIMRARYENIRVFQIYDNFRKAGNLDTFADAAESEYLKGRNILLTSPEEFSELPEYITSNYRYCCQTAGLSCYITEHCPLDYTAGFPLRKMTVSGDYPYTQSYSISNAQVNEKTGILESDGTEGVILTGTYCTPAEWNKRTYSIFADYSVTESKGENAGTMRLISNSGCIAEVPLSKTKNTAAIENITLPEPSEYKLIISEEDGTYISVSEIRFTASE